MSSALKFAEVEANALLAPKRYRGEDLRPPRLHQALPPLTRPTPRCADGSSVAASAASAMMQTSEPAPVSETALADHDQGTEAAAGADEQQHSMLHGQGDCGHKHVCLDGPLHGDGDDGMPDDGEGGGSADGDGGDGCAEPGLMTAELATDNLCVAVGQAASVYIDKVREEKRRGCAASLTHPPPPGPPPPPSFLPAQLSTFASRFQVVLSRLLQHQQAMKQADVDAENLDVAVTRLVERASLAMQPAVAQAASADAADSEFLQEGGSAECGFEGSPVSGVLPGSSSGLASPHALKSPEDVDSGAGLDGGDGGTARLPSRMLVTANFTN